MEKRLKTGILVAHVIEDIGDDRPPAPDLVLVVGAVVLVAVVVFLPAEGGTEARFDRGMQRHHFRSERTLDLADAGKQGHEIQEHPATFYRDLQLVEIAPDDRGARVRDSILGPSAIVGRDAVLLGSVLAERAKVPSGARAEGARVGAGKALGG